MVSQVHSFHAVLQTTMLTVFGGKDDRYLRIIYSAAVKSPSLYMFS